MIEQMLQCKLPIWMHLFSDAFDLYIDGEKARDTPYYRNTGTFFEMRDIYFSTHLSAQDKRCDCFVAEAEVYTRVLTEQEIYDVFSRFVDNSDDVCPKY